MRRYRNVFEEIVREGHEESFVPVETDEFEPTDLAAGSWEKIDLLRRQVEMGVPMWHDADRSDYDGLVGTIRPRADRRVTTAAILTGVGIISQER
jgi:hypothetical protein